MKPFVRFWKKFYFKNKLLLLCEIDNKMSMFYKYTDSLHLRTSSECEEWG